jgi:hypothetical protein
MFLKKSYINFIAHNKKIFFKKEKSKKRNIILLEFNNFSIFHLISSYYVQLLSKKYFARIVAYPSHVLLSYPLRKNIFEKIKWTLGLLFSLRNFGIYKSFNVDKFLSFKNNSSYENKVNKKIISLKKKIVNRRQILNIKIENILIGDLVYDTYLKSRYDPEPTIDLPNDFFFLFLKDFLLYFYFLKNFFDENSVKALVVSHNVYSLAIPVRIAISKNIEVFLLRENRIKRLNKVNYLTNSESKYYRKWFKKIPEKKRIDFIIGAKKCLLDRLSGKYSSHTSYMTKSAFSKNNNYKNVLTTSKNMKILIAPHDFVDAPHIYGNFTFPDMYQWLKFLVNFSKTSTDDWYIKVHPRMKGPWSFYQDYTKRVVLELIKNSKIIWIEPDTPHNQLIKQGIDCVLTAHGTIAHEYALMNKLVINVNSNNPHHNYKFNYHINSIEDYKKKLKEIKTLRKKINKKEIYEFYFMHYIYVTENCFFKNYSEFLRYLGNYHEQWTDKVYDYWLNNFNEDLHMQTIKKCSNYIFKNDLVYSINNNE